MPRPQCHRADGRRRGGVDAFLTDNLDDEDLRDDGFGVDDSAPENLERRPEEDVRLGRTPTGDDLGPEADDRAANG